MQTLAESKTQSATVREDVWIPSNCAMCYGHCAILGHRVDGVLVKIEGNPDSSLGYGHLCGKGVSGLMTLYDPNRLTVPLKRTNPEKGFGIDPGWKEISWEEALDEVATRMKKVRDDDPRKLFIQWTTTNSTITYLWPTLSAAFGTSNHWAAGGGLHCGSGAHLISGIMHASWSIMPDFDNCKLAVYFGASKGHAAGHAACPNMELAANARVRGMKMVVVDPMCNFASAKASEWVPIRVGTDAAMALGMCHVLVHEMGLWDAPFLKAKTNGTYLVGPDQLYMRDPDSNKPLVWDTQSSSAKTFDSVASEQMALEGEYEVNGTRCNTAFDLLKERLRSMTPEWAESISTVPAAKIRELAREFGEEARIGSTIVVDGRTIPYRPVAAIAFRGSQGHRNSVYNFLAIDMLNFLVGSSDMVGGCLGFNPTCHGHPDTGGLNYVPYNGPDGLMVTGTWLIPHLPYPFEKPHLPDSSGCMELFPMAIGSHLYASSDQERFWEMFGIDYRWEMMFNYGCNSVMSVGNKDIVAETLRRVPFIASIDLYLTEFSDFVDIILPDTSYHETLDPRPSFCPFIFNLPGGPGEWSYTIRQPMVEPVGKRRMAADVIIELAERIGMREDLNLAYNEIFKIEAPYALEMDKRYSFEEISDRYLKSTFGEQHDLKWFKEHGSINWPKKPEEVYWRHFEDVRVPIYWEYLRTIWQDANALTEPRGLKLPEEYYDPLPKWLPCPAHEEQPNGYDLIAFYYRDPLHTNSFTMENPWLDETSQLDPNTYFIALNINTARSKGIADGDEVWLETPTKRRVSGRARLTEGMHPEGVGIAACAGHWSDNMPVAKNKGVFFNELLEVDFEHCSPVNLNLDLCAKVSIRKA